MKPVYRANTFGLSIILLQIIVMLFIAGPMQKLVGYSNLMILDEYIFLLVPSVLFVLFTKQSIKETFKLNKISLKDVGIVVLIAFLAQPVAMFFSQLTNLVFENPVSEAFEAIANIPFLVKLFMIAITPAICEEAVTRGVILSGYKKIKRWKAALANGLIFGMLHMNGQQFLYAFALGIAFSYLVMITNSILSSAICHFVFNGIQVCMAQLALILAETTGAATEEAVLTLNQKLILLAVLFVIAAVFTTFIVMLIMHLDKKHNNRSNQVINEGFEENSEMAYLFKDPSTDNREIKEERVVNLPLIVTIIVFIIIAALIEYLNRIGT